MEKTEVIAIVVVFTAVAIRLIQKQRAKNLPAGTSHKDASANKGTKVNSIPDDYEPYSGK